MYLTIVKNCYAIFYRIRNQKSIFMKSKFEVKQLIQDDLNDVFGYLEEILTTKNEGDFINSIILLKSTFKETQRLNNLGVMNYEDYNRKITQVKLNILNLIDDIPNHLFEQKTNTTSFENLTIDNNYTFLTISKLIRELIDVAAAYRLNQEESLIRANLNNKRTVLVNQVTKLINTYQFSLSGIEYQVIADAFYAISDYDKAQEFYQKGIENIDKYTESAVSKISSIRNYANFLFKINQIEKGKKQYETAILAVDSTQANIQNGQTYQMQFMNQLEHRMVEPAVESFKLARAYYLKVENPTNRNLLVRDLKTIWFNSPVLAGIQMPD
jgi:tetratricopeptide (TPR) repeat protein